MLPRLFRSDISQKTQNYSRVCLCGLLCLRSSLLFKLIVLYKLAHMAGELWIRTSIFSGAGCYCVLCSAFILRLAEAQINRVRDWPRGSAEGGTLTKDTRQLPPASEVPHGAVCVCVCVCVGEGGREGCELCVCVCVCTSCCLLQLCSMHFCMCINNNAAGFLLLIYPQGSIKYFCLSTVSMDILWM